MPVLTIRRGGGWGDRLRAYEILVDGERCGELRVYQEALIDLPTGSYLVEMRIDTFGSPPLGVVLGERGATLECGPNYNLLFVKRALQKPQEWIYLRPASTP